MPFTLAHPAAILPLTRLGNRRVNTAALAIGSMAPDLAYFLPWGPSRAASHGLPALLWFVLPAGLAAYLAFHCLLAPLLCDLVPPGLCARLPASWRRGVLPACPPHLVAASILLGALTHLAWDACTHRSGWLVETLPPLARPLVTWQGYTVYGYKVLQHGSTLVGSAVVIAYMCSRLTPERPGEATRGLTARGRIALTTLVLAAPLVMAVVAGGQAALEARGALHRLQLFLGGAIFAGGQALLYSALAVGLLRRFVRG